MFTASTGQDFIPARLVLLHLTSMPSNNTLVPEHKKDKKDKKHLSFNIFFLFSKATLMLRTYGQVCPICKTHTLTPHRLSFPPHRAVNKTHVDTPHAAWQRQQKLQARSSLRPALKIWPENASPLSTRHRTQDTAKSGAERGIKRPKQQHALMPARQVQLAMAEISASESGIYVLRGGNFIMQWPTMKWAAVARNLCAKLRDSLSIRWLEEKGREEGQLVETSSCSSPCWQGS